MPRNRGLAKAASQTFERAGSRVRLLTRSLSGAMQETPRLVRNASQTFQRSPNQVSTESLHIDIDTLERSLEKAIQKQISYKKIEPYFFYMHSNLEMGMYKSLNQNIIELCEDLKTMVDARGRNDIIKKNIMKKIQILSNNLDRLDAARNQSPKEESFGDESEENASDRPQYTA